MTAVPAPLRLHLIRHPAVAAPPGVCYGQSDVPLAASPADAAARLRPLLPVAALPVPVYSSPLTRCLALARELHPEPAVDSRLMEMAFGTWEGRTWEDIGEEPLTAWAEDISDFAPPAGESARMLQGRVLEWLDDLAAEARDHDAAQEAAADRVVVTHGGVVRALVGAVLGIAPADWFRLQVDFAAVTLVEWPLAAGALPRLLALNR